MNVGELIFCIRDDDSIIPIIANKVYQIVKITDNMVFIDLDQTIGYNNSDIKEFFKPLSDIIQDLKIKTFNKKPKEQIKELIPYIYWDSENECFLLSTEIIQLYRLSPDYQFIIRVVGIILDLMNNMNIDELDQFYTLEWDYLWDKIGEQINEKFN